MWLKQFADGKIVGNLGGNAWVTHAANYNSWLPSFEANFRIKNNWSVYGQYGRGSIIPFSSVFDVTGAQVAVTPPPTIASTYQGGTVLKLNHLSLDGDFYHIHFVNQYSSFTPSSGPDAGFTYYYATPPSDTNGVEGEGNLYLAHGLSLFLNGTFGEAKYESSSGQAATGTTPAVPASPSAWVANAPHDTESLGLTYQQKAWDVGIFNKRVGDRWNDDGAYHQVVPLDPFWMSNFFFNYTLRKGSRFDQSKIKLSVNNVFDNHDVVTIGPGQFGLEFAGSLYAQPCGHPAVASGAERDDHVPAGSLAEGEVKGGLQSTSRLPGVNPPGVFVSGLALESGRGFGMRGVCSTRRRAACGATVLEETEKPPRREAFVFEEIQGLARTQTLDGVGQARFDQLGALGCNAAEVGWRRSRHGHQGEGDHREADAGDGCRHQHVIHVEHIEPEHVDRDMSQAA